jgi:hypothetical protein
MTASSPFRRSSSSTNIDTAKPDAATSWDEVGSMVVIGPVGSAVTNRTITISSSAMLSIGRGQAVTSTANVTIGGETISAIPANGPETHQLAESRRLTWPEMLKATEQAVRLRESFSRALRDIEADRERSGS